MGLITEIGADASNYNKVMAGLPGTANKASNEISQSLAKASKAMDTFGGQTVKSASASGIALNNLSRVVQDVPFGFIGIQNNLNPLLESFQRLKQETGSTGGALKALLSQLTGAGGLGLALAAVSSAFTIYTLWQQKARKATKDTTDEMQSYVDSLDAVSRAQLKGQQEGETELTRLKLLYNATQDHKLSLTQRNEAYDELSRKYQKFFPDAEREKTLLGDNKKAYEELANAIMQAAYAKAFEEEITRLEKAKLVDKRKFLDLTKQETDAQNQLNKSRQTANELSKAASSGAGQGAGGFLMQQTQLNKQLNDIAKQKNALIDSYNAKTKEQEQLSGQASAAELAAHFKTQTELDDKTGKIKEQKTQLQLLEDQLKKLKDAETQWLEAGNQQDFFNLTKTERDINALTEKINTLKSKISGVNAPTLNRVSEVAIDTTPKSNETEAGFKKAIKSLKDLNALKGASMAQSKELKQELREEDSLLKTLSNTIGQGLTGAFQAAISGTQSFADAFGQFIVDLITKLMAAIAAAAVLAALLSFTGLSSFTSVGAAFGGSGSQMGSFANLVGQFTGVKLATGGVTTGPTHALIGEGREQEAVLPLSHLDKMLENNKSGGAGDMQLNTKISGTDLLIWLSRANKQANRIGGKT